MRPFSALFALGFLVLAAGAPSASAMTIYISGTTSGCYGGSNGQACSNGTANMFQGDTVNLINPVTQTFGPGTYTITNGDLTGPYSAWRFDRGNNWAWNFGITVDNSANIAGTGKVFLVGGSAGVASSQAAMATSNGPNYGGPNGPTLPQLSASGGPAAYSLSFTLAATTTLNFFVLDYDLSDNAGGVALKITDPNEVPLPAALPLFVAAIAGAGGWSAVRRRRAA